MPASENRRPPVDGFERAALTHVGVLLAATTWGFGGNALFVRPYLALWGSLGPLLLIAALLANPRRARISYQSLHWLWPFALYNALAVLSCFTPLLSERLLNGTPFYVPLRVPAWQPGAAQPGLVAPALWLFDAIYLSCFNLLVLVQHRRSLRGLLLFSAANALALSVFGTVQKLLGAKGIYFGLVKPRQPYFFATFIYHNHWGAFIVLMCAICLGLVRYYAQRSEGRDFFHTPAFGGIVTVLFLALTVPLSTSRSCTALLALLLGGAFFRWVPRLIRQRQSLGESAGAPLLGAGLAIVLSLAGVWYFSGKIVEQRVAKTVEQIADMRARGSIGSRLALYRDTWRMAEDRLWFGWGTASYPSIFWAYNTQEPNPLDHLPVFYADAHSDWLQAVAEHGLLGTALLGLGAALPLLGLRRRQLRSPLTYYPLAGCGLILLYAWIEFPFGNVAVVLAWWLCFFTAVRYARLTKTVST